MSTDAARQTGPGHRRASVLRAEHRTAAPLLVELESPARRRDAVVSPDWSAGYEAGAIAERAAGAAALEAAGADLVSARARIDMVAGALADAADDLRSRQALALEHLGRSLVDAALEIAAAVLGREISAGPAAAHALERALALLPPSAPAEVCLHPDDVPAIGALDRPGLVLVADATVERGGCVVRFDDGSIDAQIGPALERVRRVLLDDTEESW